MTKINKQRVEEFIRVDHAGERGAVKIYEGQLLALSTIKQDKNLKKIIEETHPYDVPEIAEIDVTSINKSYLNWLIESTN